MKSGSGKTEKIVTAGLMAALIFAVTFINIPNGLGGCTHAGDAAVLLAAVTLGRKYGAAAAGIGGAAADLLLGYAMWAPFTLICKVILVCLFTLLLDKGKSRPWWFLSAAAAFAAETAVYCAAAYFLEGGIGAAAVEAFGMLIQSAAGILLGRFAVSAVEKTGLKKYMIYGDR